MWSAGVLAVSSLVAAEPDLAADAKAPPQEAIKRQSKRGRNTYNEGFNSRDGKDHVLLRQKPFARQPEILNLDSCQSRPAGSGPEAVYRWIDFEFYRNSTDSGHLRH
jgi:hypothetical protein